MAGKTKNMSQIKQLLLLHQQGKGKKTIARILGISKNTVKECLQKAAVLTINKSALTIEKLINLENPVLESKFHSGNPAYKEDRRYDCFKEKLPWFLQELKRKGVTRHLLWQEYQQQHADAYSYSQFCFHLQQQQSLPILPWYWNINRVINFSLTLQEVNYTTRTGPPVSLLPARYLSPVFPLVITVLQWLCQARR